MHGSPFLHRTACILAERSRSAPQLLELLMRDGRPSLSAPDLEPPHRRAPARAPALAPSPRRSVFYIIPSLHPARIIALVDPRVGPNYRLEPRTTLERLLGTKSVHHLVELPDPGRSGVRI
eukprot:3619473-Pleurochrysis_carterae.AAC.1